MPCFRREPGAALLLIVNKAELNETGLIQLKSMIPEILALVYYTCSRKFDITLLFQD
ncbi:hypothetical protein MESS2_1470012 [Mesorhizobium metallidurans STM 2683]|uniref:Uncharacterized protein n=1 Tax=Mesorhizobium metallidurans STM 2683 TaxID=1297569 RepID=M5EZJ5_9HYPH|nr:hypothetical protein MESS2_1470012 [Mesorhizobium metallidurans STM 2683]